MERYPIKIDGEYIDIYAESFSEAFDKALRIAANRNYSTIEMPALRPNETPDSLKPQWIERVLVVIAALAIAASAGYALGALYKLLLTLVGA